LTVAGAPVLEVQHVSKSFGQFLAVSDVSFSLAQKEALAIVGPNGAGKSTLFDLLTGRKIPSGGEVRLFGEPVTNLPPWDRVKRGLGRSFQVSSVFPAYTAQQNVQIGLMIAHRRAWNLWRPGASMFKDEASNLLTRVGLHAKQGVLGGELSHGDQRSLELALALASSPKVLLLDEPTAGMGREESGEWMTRVKEIAERERLPIAFVEHDMRVVFSLATRVIVLVSGRLLVDGRPEDVRADPRVKEAYFGEQF
jgi:branched-chain amino acid transport system ATP-binding protein